MCGARRAAMLVFLSTLAATAASGINDLNKGMPNRISMNVTVPKQTQGATFGEKVQSGMQSAGSARARDVRLVIECGTSACVVALPDGSGYRAELASMTLAPLDAAQGTALLQGAAGASLIGGALPGGSVLSAAVSSVSSLAGSGGGAAAAYAATGRSAAPGPLASRTREDGGIDVTEPLGDGDYALTLIVEKATGGLKDTLKTQVRMAAPAAAPSRVSLRFVFSVADGALHARPDSSENSMTEVK